MAEEFKGLTQEQIDKIEQFKSSASEIYKSYRNLNKELSDAGKAQDELGISQFRQVNITKDIAKLQKEAIDSVNAVKKLEEKKNTELARAVALEAKRNKLYSDAKLETGRTRELLISQAENLANAADQAKFLAEAIKEVQEDAAKLDKSASFFGDLSRVVGDIPGLRKLSGPFDAAATASKEMALQNAKGGKQMSTLVAGANAFGKSLLSAARKFLPLLAIDLAIKGFKFIIDLFVGANKQAVELARSMGQSVDQADVLRGQFAQIRRNTGETRNNTVQLVKAQQALNEEYGAAFNATDAILDNQTFLTSRVKLSADEASRLAINMSATGESAKQSNENINSFLGNFAKATGVSMSFKGVMSSVADAGGQIAASFGFSNEAIAKGVLQVRRFGLNLQQASNVASNLLDFEQSIGAELEAELLTGQQFNLERARAKAATGDIAGATADVLSQMQNLTAEQRRSPVIMEAIAKATGLSADEIQKAYLIQTNQNHAAKEYARLIREGTRGEANAFAIRAGLDKATIKQINERKNIEEGFAEAMEDLKSTFTDLVKGGFLKDLTKGAKMFANVVNKLAYTMGVADPEGDLKKIQESNASASTKAIAEKLKKQTEGSFFKDMLLGIGNPLGGAFASFKSLKRMTSTQQLENMAGNVKSGEPLEDFTIRAHPKDSLVMAGGTQFGKETNTLLRQLISAVEKGATINLEGRKVGETLVMSSYKS